MSPRSASQHPKPATREMKRLLMTLVSLVVGLDAGVMGLYFGFHVADRPVKTQESFVAVWVVLTLIVVTTMMKKIRQARRRR
jgi:ABC-type microcin C transport system permease subunit YejE